MQEELEWTTYDLAMHSKYLKQQMKMIWRLPWWFYVEERILRKTKKRPVKSTKLLKRFTQYGDPSDSTEQCSCVE